MGVRVLRTPVRAPTANSFCERFGGTLRRECLDFLIPFNERHLKFVLNNWIAHFNHSNEATHESRARNAGGITSACTAEHSSASYSCGTRCDALPFSGDSIMSIGSSKLLREPRVDFFADHRAGLNGDQLIDR
jgi:hypothetical protein